MDSLVKYLIVSVKFLTVIKLVNSHTYTVKVGTESHINVVDERFLSFTVDPKYLFSSSEKYNSKESVCMAASLTPAYIRIAGPSTSHMTLHNSSITFTDLTSNLDIDHSKEQDEILKKTKDTLTLGLKKKLSLDSDEEETRNKKSKETFGLRKRFSLQSGFESDEEVPYKRTVKNKRQSSLAKGLRRAKDKFSLKKEKERVIEEPRELAVSHSQWRQFAQWAKNTGFDLVFALNNEEKTDSGLWDPNSALNILTLAEKDNVSRVYWQLGYECKNQSIDDYLNDLETLRAIVESFDAQEWRAVGGDVTQCLQADSKSDFNDYVTLSDDMMDAVVLNGNSSAQELQRMSEHDRVKLLKLLSGSSTPLWLVDSPQGHDSEFHRAADWMTSLGYSAKNGFAVHFRELVEEELYEPTLSFYMALLFKNLAGERVLNIDMEASQAVVFAHCTSLRHKPVPGAVTLYGANMDDETARFAVKLSRREDGGDIMQFILGHDLSGNIIINGRPIYEGDIRPIVKRVRPYKTLLLNLPPKSFGFWVIANTKIEACQELEEEDISKKDFVEAITVDEDYASPNTIKTKRSMIKDGDEFKDVSKETLVKESLRERVFSMNNNLQSVNKVFELKAKDDLSVHSRNRRQLEDNDGLDFGKRKFKKFMRNKAKHSEEPKPRLNFLRKLFGLPTRVESARVLRHDKVKKSTKSGKNRGSKRNSKALKADNLDENTLEDIVTSDFNKKINRKRRSVINEKQNVSHKKSEELSLENEIDEERQRKLWKILHKIHKQIKDIPLEDDGNARYSESMDSKEEENIIVKTKMAANGATINFKEKTKHGLLKSTVNSVVSVLGDLNHNLNRFWNALTLLE